MVNYTTSYHSVSDSFYSTSDGVFADDASTSPVNGTDKCHSNNSLFTIAFIPFKVILVLVNMLILTAAAIDREKLKRQNYTYYCVISTLLSNTLYIIMSIWLTVDNYPQSSLDPQENIMSPAKYVWILSEAFTESMVLGICTNVTSLIYVSLDNVFYVGRGGAEWGGRLGKEENAKLFKTRMARLLIAASWVLPLLLVAITFGWNCAKVCRCPSNNFDGKHCPDGHGCSHMWAPMKINFLFIVIGIWAAQVVGLVIFLIKGIRRHRRSTALPLQSSSSSTDKIHENVENPRYDVPATVSPSDGVQGENTTGFTRRKSILKRKLNSKFKFATVLTIVLVGCTFPAAIATLIDSFMEDPPYATFLLVSGIFMFIYCAICPMIIWKYFPTLRSSTLKLLMRMKSCSCSTSRDKKKSAAESSVRG